MKKRDQIVELAERGLSAKMIAAQVPCELSWIYQVTKQCGIKLLPDMRGQITSYPFRTDARTDLILAQNTKKYLAMLGAGE